MRQSLLALFMAVCIVSAHVARASEGALETANAVLDSIGLEQFEEAAAQFRYPDTYSVEELRAEKVVIASSLRSLFKATGKFAERPTPEIGVFVTLKFTISAGGGAHKLPQAVPTTSAAYRFAPRLRNYPDGRISLDLDNDAGIWKVRSISFGLPASDPSSVGRMKAVFGQVAAALQHGSK
jgi:hypothetical protein